MIQQAMRLTIESAKQTCYIANAYFLPPRKLRNAIATAATNGVDVRLLMAGEGQADVPIVRWGSQHIYAYFLRQGVRIYELQSQTLHSKLVTIDHVYSSIGSFNFDRWSNSRNLEVNMSILDPIVSKEVERQFLEDLKNAKEITLNCLKKRPWFEKIFHWFAYHVSRL